jgi:hypothetical protein
MHTGIETCRHTDMVTDKHTDTDADTDTHKETLLSSESALETPHIRMLSIH